MKIIIAVVVLAGIGLVWWYTKVSDSMPTAPVADTAKTMDVILSAAGESMQGKPAADKVMDKLVMEQPMAKETLPKEAMPANNAGIMGGQYVAYTPKSSPSMFVRVQTECSPSSPSARYHLSSRSR